MLLNACERSGASFFPTVCLFGICMTLVLTGIAAEGQAQPGPAAPDLFDRMDRNRDGQLSAEEIPMPLMRLFEQMDQNRNRILTREEAREFVETLNRRDPLRSAGPRMPRIPEGTEIYRDVPYVENGHERQKLDVFVPAHAEGSLPIIVWVHGGGWQNGSKEQNPALLFLEQGYVVASINYRLSQHAVFPAQIHDCKAAVRFLKTHAEKYHIDTNKIGVWGASAGGHLVALLGTSGDDPTLEGTLGETGCDSKVQAVCDYFGPADIAPMSLQVRGGGSPKSPLTKLIGGPPAVLKELSDSASPVTYISEGDPPFLIVHGDQDQVVPLDQSVQLHKLLSDKGIPAELHVVKGAGHGPFRQPEVMEMVMEFFAKNLKP